MYIILYWVTDEYMTAICNNNGSIRIFETINEADDYAEKCNLDTKVVSIESTI